MDGASAAESNLWAMHGDFARVPGARVHDEPGLLWFSLPSPHCWLNGASRTQLPAKQAEAAIERVVTSIHGRGRDLLWHVTPGCRPSTLTRMLERRGFEVDVETAMAATLDTAAPRVPAELEIEHAKTPADVLKWLAAFDRGMAEIEPRGQAHPWRDAFGHLALGATSPCRLFIGSVAGAAVACSLAFVGGGAVGLYGVGTAPEHRGRGYGSALTFAGMQWGRSRGEKLAILHATEMGRPVYARLGFTRVWEHRQAMLARGT